LHERDSPSRVVPREEEKSGGSADQKKGGGTPAPEKGEMWKRKTSAQERKKKKVSEKGTYTQKGGKVVKKGTKPKALVGKKKPNSVLT